MDFPEYKPIDPVPVFDEPLFSDWALREECTKLLNECVSAEGTFFKLIRGNKIVRNEDGSFTIRPHGSKLPSLPEPNSVLR